jgi:hypothetical protein
MKGAGPVFNQREQRATALQFQVNEIFASLDFDRIPPAPAYVFHEPVRSNATGTAVDQRCKRLCVETARAPIAENHGRGSAPAEGLRL